MTDEDLMRLALAEAHAAEAAGEVPVGAIVLSPMGEIIGRGNNAVIRSADPTAHAEIIAMRAAAAHLGNYRLTGCTVVCTLEPCAMCAGAMIHARIAALVYASRDPKAGADGSVLAVLNHSALNHRIEVREGVLGEEAGAMLSNFFRRKRKLPLLDSASHQKTGESAHGNQEGSEEINREEEHGEEGGSEEDGDQENVRHQER
jgi:tRNA(adenine34) deaminase